MDEISKKKILYIEDDQGLAKIYVARMRSEGFDVLYCASGEAALQQVKLFHPDLILVDIMMPSLSGYDTIELLRGTLEAVDAKIVVLSALGQPEDITKAKAAGADDYLVKSQVLIDDVMQRLHAYVGG